MCPRGRVQDMSSKPLPLRTCLETPSNPFCQFLGCLPVMPPITTGTARLRSYREITRNPVQTSVQVSMKCLPTLTLHTRLRVTHPRRKCTLYHNTVFEPLETDTCITTSTRARGWMALACARMGSQIPFERSKSTHFSNKFQNTLLDP